MKNAKSRITTFLVIASSALFAACGGGGGGGGGTAVVPTPGPTAAATATPTLQPSNGGKLILSASSLSFTSETPQMFAASDPNFKGTFSVSGCTNIVNATSAKPAGPSATFTVTPVVGGAAGSCTLTVSEGSSAGTATLSVSSTITQGTIQ